MKFSFRSSLQSILAVCILSAASLPTFLLAQDSTAAPIAGAPAPGLITQPVDETRLTRLKGNTHPLARPEFDLGTAPATLPMQRMLLVLKRSPQQESALRRLLDDQQDKASPNYHKWLTPEQFGRQFGPSDADMHSITSWLQSQGFQVGTSKGRTVLEFSGSASQVQEAFHTTIHKYVVNGEQHWANASDPQIPTALTPAVVGVLTLHNFLKKPHSHGFTEPVAAKIRPGKRPEITFSDGTHGLGPEDYATIYNNPAVNGSVNNGAGIQIAAVGRSNLFNGGKDIAEFANAFGCCGRAQVVLNGPDPGDLGGGEELEATLDATWANGVAFAANVDLVVSASTNTTDGIDLSEVYIIENNLADIMTESFGSCEAFYNSSDAAGVSALAEQAAAQGISYFVSTGDNGAEGCDDFNSETVATGPVSVSLLASTPFNTAVGGNVFNEHGLTTYWSSANTGQESALSYIPENVWNDSCLEATCGSSANILAGSGGASMFFTKPSWQSGVTGILPDGTRDIPDVSLTAAGHDPYLLCIEGSCKPDAQGNFFIYFVFGTSASTPSFASIMALVDQQMANLNPAQGPRQGLANYILYRLAATETLSQCNGSSTMGQPASTCIFNDVTVGDNAVPGEVNYGLSTADYQAGQGYDMATGLGSVNITNLVNQWSTVTFNPTNTSLLLNNKSSITIAHGQSVNVEISVAPNSGTGKPTGDVSLMTATGGSGESGIASFTLTNGTVAQTTNQLPGGGPYSATAHYAGDATYAPSDSGPVSVTVSSETSTTTLSGPYTLDQFGEWTVPFTTPQPFGTPVFVGATVGGASGFGSPTGAISFSSPTGSIPNGADATLNSQGTASVQSNPFLVNGPTAPFDAGQYSVSASYGGDASFKASSSTQPVTFTIQPGFFANVPASQSQVVVSAPGSGGSSSVTVVSSTGFTGTISLSCSGLPSEAACQFTPPTITANGTLTTNTVGVIVSTTAPTAALRSPQQKHLGHWLAAGIFMLFSVVLVGAPRQRRLPSLLLLLALIVFIPGCGGSSSQNHLQPPPNPGTPKGTYSVTVTATASGAPSSSTGFFLFVQ